MTRTRRPAHQPRVNIILLTTLSTNIIPIPRAREFSRFHTFRSLKKPKASFAHANAGADNFTTKSSFNDRTFRVRTSQNERRARMAWEQRHADGISTSSARASRRRQHHRRDHSQTWATRLSNVCDMMDLPLQERGMLSARPTIARRFFENCDTTPGRRALAGTCRPRRFRCVCLGRSARQPFGVSSSGRLPPLRPTHNVGDVPRRPR